METMCMQNFGGTNKEYYGIFESSLLAEFRQYRALPARKTNNPFDMNVNICDPPNFFDIHKVKLVFSLCERRNA